MKSRLSASVGKGPLPYALKRRLVRGWPSMVRSCRSAATARSKCGSSAVNSCSIHPVIARQLPARWVTSSYLGIGTSALTALSLGDATLQTLIVSNRM
jgi:hypothetical protein